MNEERKEGFWTAREKRGLKIAGMILTCLAVGYVLVRIWPLPQFFGHRSFWRLPTNVAAEKPATPPVAKPASKATLDSIAKDLKDLIDSQKSIQNKLNRGLYQVRYDLDGLYNVGQLPWLYVAAVDSHSVQVSLSKFGRPVEYFETGKVVFVSFAEKAGGVARRLTEEDVNNENLLLSVVAWGREKAEKSDGYVNGLILADVGPPTTPLSVNGKTTTVGERCQRLVGELLAREVKEEKSAAEAADADKE